MKFYTGKFYKTKSIELFQFSFRLHNFSDSFKWRPTYVCILLCTHVQFLWY